MRHFPGVGLAARFVCFCVALCAILPVSAWSQAYGATDGGDQLVFGAGATNVLHRQKETLARAEYSFATSFWGLRPFVGGELTSGGGAYGYGGIGLDVPLGDVWILTPNVAIGAWERGNGKNLGSPFELRTGAEVDYRLSRAVAVGVSFHHVSNGGVVSHNPGEEEALAVIRVEISALGASFFSN